MNQLSKPVRQVAAVGLLLLAVLLLATLVVLPLMERFDTVRERIATEREMLGRLMAATSRQAGTREAGQDAAAINAAFLKGESEAIQLAELQALLKDIAAGQGLRLLSLRTLPAVDRDGLRLIGVRADLNGSVPDVQKLLHKLETSRPLLILDFLEMEPMSTARGDPAKSDVLVVGFNIYGAVSRRKG